MKRGIALLAGGVWELIRFVGTFLLTVVAAEAGQSGQALQIWSSAPALILCVLFFASAFYPSRYPAYLPVMRLGALLAALSTAIVAVSQGFRWVMVPTESFLSSPALRAAFLLTVAFDLVVVAVLFVASAPQQETEPDEPDTEHPGANDGRSLPDYETTEVKGDVHDSEQT